VKRISYKLKLCIFPLRLPDRDDAATTETQYSCIYGFQQYVPGGEDLLDSTDLWLGDNQGSVQQVKNSGYIVEGSNFEGQINITNSTVEPEHPREQFYGLENRDGETVNTEQEFLETHAANTTTYLASQGPLFTHYPEGVSRVGPTKPNKTLLVSFIDRFSP